MLAIIDKYGIENGDQGQALQSDSGTNPSEVGQTFLSPQTVYLEAVEFYVQKTTVSPPGSVTANLYAHTGTFGTTGTAVGSPLAVSNSRLATSFSDTYTLERFTFSGSNLYQLVSGTAYGIALVANGLTDIVLVRYDFSSPSHAGAFFWGFNAGTFASFSNSDTVFYLYGSRQNPLGIMGINIRPAAFSPGIAR